MPTEDEYRQLYEISYFSAASDESAPPWLLDYAAVPYEEALTAARINAYLARLGRLASAFPDRGTLLDVGMATGEFAAMAVADGWRVCGLEVSAEACSMADGRGIEVHCGDVLTAALADRKFDVVHLNHVFEHFTNPRAALERLVSFMRPGSLLIVEVPNQFDSWTRRLVNRVRLATGSKVGRSVLSIHHPFFYTKKTIEKMLNSHARLEIVWCRTYFPERWAGPAYRQVLRLIDLLGDLVGRHGENVEVAARL